MTSVYRHLANGIHTMTTPPNAPEVDVLDVLDDVLSVKTGLLPDEHAALTGVRTAVAAMLTREAALVAERDALAAEVGALRGLADKWERIGWEHGVRQFTGNDHLMFANELRAVSARAEAGHG